MSGAGRNKLAVKLVSNVIEGNRNTTATESRAYDADMTNEPVKNEMF